MPSASLLPAAFDPGSVWLVGAGSGDPGLLTPHAVHGLCEADVILHDALVSEEILSLAGPRARLEFVGRRAGGRRTAQLRINQLRINQRLIELARQGHRVACLKGGDPLIFGRGGEEALALAAAGIPFRVVPGISAGVGGLAAASIPLTHRGLSRNVTFVTGHDAAEVERVATNDVLVIYMGGGLLADIAACLIASGRDRRDAVAVIRNATSAEQTVHVTTLGAAEFPAASPAPTLLVVGPVVTIQEQLRAWQQTAPMTVIAGQQARSAG
jgi:uroporphyrin-III C-methyltransferase